MKKVTLIISLMLLAVSFEAAGITKKSSQRRYITPEEVHVTVSPAALQKADAIYESVSKDYSQGKLSASKVGTKAHGATWNMARREYVPTLCIGRIKLQNS